MPSYARMKRIFLEGLLWLFLLQYGLMARSLEPGFLDFDNLPDTNFTCVGKVIGGYYADLETNCQMFHVCTIGQADEPMDIRFLCLNGTVFDQETRVCERIDEVDCSKSEQFYSLNLELYGNSGPILEETPEVNQETESPSIIIKSTVPTTTTTTTTKRPTTKPQYYTTIRPSTATNAVNKPQQTVSGHHFPVNAPDIRFNPEEINISLNPGAPPDIRTKHFQPHYSDSFVTDNDEEQSVRIQQPERARVSSTTSPKSIYGIDASDSDKLLQSSDDNFGFSEGEFHSTELPRQQQQQFLIQTNSFRHSQSFPPNVNHNANQYHHPQFHSTTVKQPTHFHQDPSYTTARTLYLHSLKPPEIHQHHHYTHHPRTEKTPQRVQIPIPLLPTLPPLTFSSPAPFTLQRHIETKRYTKDHQTPPRIIISASASVSDASGRRLNYSLGTIGAAQILETPPSSYDEYKDSDVGLDPFYHDVPKLKERKRKRRNVEEKKPEINPFEIIKSEKEAVEVLKFLFTWYQSHQATATVPSVTSPISPDLIQKINDELSPAIDDSTLKTDSSEFHFTKEPSSTESISNSELFKKSSKYSIVGGYRDENVNHRQDRKDVSDKSSIDQLKELESVNGQGEKEANKHEFSEKMDNVDIINVKDAKDFTFNPDDYVDDNYEGMVYKEPDEKHLEHLNPKEESKSSSTNNIKKQNEKDLENLDAKGEDKSSSTNINKKQNEKDLENFNSKEEDHSININGEDPIDTKHPNLKEKGISTDHKVEEIVTNLEDKLLEIFDSEDKNKTDATTTNKPLKVLNVKYADIHLQENDNVEKHIVDPAAISELYKYFNVNNQLTKNPKLNYYLNETEDRLEGNSKEGRPNSAKEETANLTGSHNHSIENLKESVRFTEINVLSEVNEADGEAKSSSTTSTTTTTTIAPKYTVKRRGRGRQRHVDSTQEASYKSNVSKPQENRNYISTDSRSNNRRGRYRARSRFGSSTTTTQGTTTTTTTTTTEIYPIETTSIIAFDTTLPDMTQIDTTTDGKFLIEVSSSEKTHHNESLFTHTEDFNNVTDENSKPDLDENVKNHTVDKGIKDKPIIDIKESEHENIAHSEESTPKSDILNITMDSNTLKESEDTNAAIINTITTETSTVPLPVKEKKEDHKPISELSATDNPSYLIKLLRYYAETALNEPPTTNLSNVSYDPVTEIQETTTPSTNSVTSPARKNRQRVRYRHSSRVSTTELPTLRDVYDSTKSLSEENLEESPIDSLIHIDFNTSNVDITNEELEDKHIKTKSDLLEKLSLLEKKLVDKFSTPPVTTSSIIADTTATTPMVSFEDPASFGTTFSVATKPTKITEYSTGSGELTKMFEITTEPITPLSFPKEEEKHKNYHSFYDDLFVVPESTEKTLQTNKDMSSDFTIKILESTESIDKHPIITEITNKAHSEIESTIYPSHISTIIVQDIPQSTDDAYKSETTTPMSDVEVQKSISLPISVLESNFDEPYNVNDAQDINGLAPVEEEEVQVQQSTATILDIPSTETVKSTTEVIDNTVTETVPVSIATTEMTMQEYIIPTTTSKYTEEHMKNLQDVVLPEVQHNATEIIFFKNSESEEPINTSMPSSMDVKSPFNSSHLLQVVVETTTNEPSITTTTTSSLYLTKNSKPPKRRPYTNQRNKHGRHRFNTELFTTDKPPKAKQNLLKSEISKETITDAPLHRSATPTRSELKKVLLHTTPLSSKNSLQSPTKVSKHYVFNCFGKETSRFYADPRDCRLFHYCTQGYSKNQLLDLKYVCDQKTFFDEDKLICTKVKPARCL